VHKSNVGLQILLGPFGYAMAGFIVFILKMYFVISLLSSATSIQVVLPPAELWLDARTAFDQRPQRNAKRAAAS
jgi:hypothetical protein